jgi:uncharacterized protein (TIGR03435 family)
VRKKLKLKKLTIIVLAIPFALAQTAPVWKEFSIGPATRNQSGFSREGIRAEGIPLKRALARAWGLPEHRIIGPEWIAEQRYAMTALVNDPQDLQPLLQDELTRRLKMVAHRETREMPVYVLRALEGQTPQQTPPDGAKIPDPAMKGDYTLQISNSQIRSAPISTADFVTALSDAIQRPVIDETHLPGTFRFNLSWKATDFASMQKAVNAQLGLQLAEEKRNVDVLVIEHIEPL